MQHILAATLLLGLAILPGCAESSSTTAPGPTTLQIGGTWNGSVTVSGTDGRMTWVLSQNGTAITGPVSIGLPSGIVLMNGTFNGTLTGSALAGTIAVTPGGIPVYPACTGQLTATMNVTLGVVSSMNGPVSLVASTCTVPFTSSTVTLTRQ
ncbi:MAG TPA: hypothetical protein VKH42_06445 [Vicinamibacterales bacterium]|nr:hypothetical protein [Vicinamibacterales bacterium]